MNTFDNSKFEAETQEKWGKTKAYKEYAEKTKDYSNQKRNELAEETEHIMEEFALCMKRNEKPDSAQAKSLVKKLQNHITDNYYHCTNEILSNLGQMYVEDERFKNNIDKYASGTAAFVCAAIQACCCK